MRISITLLHLSPLWILFFHSSTALEGLGLLYGFSRSHSDTTRSVGLLWTNDRPVAETSNCQHTTLKTDRH
jgi:hypothetical protein